MCDECTEIITDEDRVRPVPNTAGEMNPRVKTIWTRALRSNEFGQVRASLRDTGNGRCCLGVLCDVLMNIKPGIGRWDGESFKDTGAGMYGEAGLPSLTVFDEAGFDAPRATPENQYTEFSRSVILPFRHRDGGIQSLACLNDSGVPFNQIADLIDYFL